MEFHKLNSYLYLRKKNLEKHFFFLKNCPTFLLSEPPVFSVRQSCVIFISPEQVNVLNLESRLSDTLPILARLLISFLLLANQLYTLREVTRSRSDNFFPITIMEGKKEDRQTTLVQVVNSWNINSTEELLELRMKRILCESEHCAQMLW